MTNQAILFLEKVKTATFGFYLVLRRPAFEVS